MHRRRIVWISLTATFFALGVGTSVWASPSQMAPSPPSSLPFTPWGPFWPDCCPPTLKVLRWPSLDAGVLKPSHGLPAIASVFSVACHSPNPFSDSRPLPLHTLPPILPRLPLVPSRLTVSTGPCVVILRRNTGQCTRAPRLTSPTTCSQQYKHRGASSSPKLSCTCASHLILYGAFLCS